MTSLPKSPRSRLLAALALGTLLFVPSQPASAQFRAATNVKDGSLSMVPADAAFYTSTMRLGETFETFVNSNAYDRLANLESVKAMTEEFQQAWNDPNGDFAQARAVLESPETQETLAFLGDMVSNEWWSVGDMKHADLVELGGHLGRETQRVQNEMQLKQARGEEVNPMDIVNGFIKVLDTHRDLIVIPNSVTGFKVTDSKRAAKQLAALDASLAGLFQGNPQFANAYTKKTIGDTEFMVLDLEGKMVPWQLIGFFVQGIDFQAFNRVVGQLNGLELTLAIGLEGDQVLFLMGESSAYLETLGQGDLLIDRPEFAAVRENADKRFTSIAYVSEAYRKRTGGTTDAAAAIQQMSDALAPAIQQMDLNDDIRAMIDKDLRDLAEWLETQESPEPKATLSFEYATDRGYEGYAYDWSKNTMLDGSKPLPLVQHVGGNPVGFYVTRTVTDPEDYDTMVVVLSKMYGYLETYLMTELSDEDRAEYQKVMKIVQPQLKRLDDTTRNKLVPAMRDGQGAIVLDMAATSRQWFRDMPPARKPVALPQLAFVYGVSDSDLLNEAFADYHAIAQDLLDDLHEYSPDEIPEIKLPTAEREQVADGTVFHYAVPQQSGIDEQIAPSAGLSDSVAAWTFMPSQTKRILATTAVPGNGGVLSNVDRPLAGAGRFDFARFVDGVEPWIEYGIEQYYASQAVGTDADEVFFQDPPMEQVLGEVRTIADVLKCFRGYSSVTTIENGATVTHFDYEFKDLD